jgi:hypothetical protein
MSVLYEAEREKHEKRRKYYPLPFCGKWLYPENRVCDG